MKRKNVIKMPLSLLLVTAMLLLSACGGAEDLTSGIQPNEVDVSSDLTQGNVVATDFALRLFRASSKEGENTLLSPLSVLSALAMTANGAEEETLQEMEEVLGMTTEELNGYLHTYMKSLPQGKGYKLHLANSVWFRDGESFAVNGDFLQTNADYYGADIYRAPFDEKTCNEINAWVKKHTDGMIPKILQQLPPEAVMCLVNALAFEAEWAQPYEDARTVRDGVFTREDGTEQTATFMHSQESTYLADDIATGLMKYYKGGKYAFAALLPNEGVSVTEYLASLDGEKLHTILAEPQSATVFASIPKFEVEYDAELSEVLVDMGISDAFDPNRADFSGLGTSDRGNIYINQVLHKTFISVAEKGTKAGATTVVEMADGGVGPLSYQEVYLDRPFVYMLVDCESGTPLFIGTMMDISTD